MKNLTRIIDWLTAWYSPVSGELIDALENASKEAGKALGNAKPYEYALYVARKNVIISDDKNNLLNRFLNYTFYLWQGRPQPLSLYQKQATGMIGPFAKIRKSRRTKGKIKENALLFWPAPNGAIDPECTKQVAKIAVGDANLAREIKMLRLVGAGTGLTPPIISYDPDLKWHMIRFIGNAKRLDETGQAKIYLHHIAEKYFKFWGTRSRSIQRTLKALKISESDFVKTAYALGLENPQSLLAGNLSYSITHGGGICEECLLTEDGDAYFLDWEKARLAPIGDDLLQVFPYYPDETMNLFKQLTAKGDLPIREQLWASLICRHFANTRKRSPIREKIRLDETSAELLRQL